MKKKSKNLCECCIDCCTHLAMEIDKPASKTDYQNIIWYLLHENVSVYIDEDNSWNIEFKTPCKVLTKNGICKIYKNRPKICRNYSQQDCTKYGTGKYYKHLFKTREQFINFLKKKKIDFEFKHSS